MAVDKNVNAADTRHRFDLEVGEFVTQVKIDVGTIYGAKFSKVGGTDNPNYSGEGHATLRWNTSGMIFTPVLSHGHRNYFPGDIGQEFEATKGDRWFMESVITMDGEAKYILPGAGADPAFNSNKARGSLSLNTFWNFGLERYNHSTPTFTPNNKRYYQGGTFTINYLNDGSTPNTSYGTDYEYNVNLYVSVHKYFDIFSVTNYYRFQSVKDIPGSDYRLYTYKGKASGRNTVATLFTLYVRPDSVASSVAVPLVTPISNVGVSHEDFDRYLVAGHENSYPYAKMSFVNLRPFPASWGITDKNQYLLPGVAGVTIERRMMDRIELLASNQGEMVREELAIYEHNKGSVELHAFFGNLLDAPLDEYELELIIPKIARDTPY